MKLLHTSDWHLGRYFHQHSLLADQAYVLEQIVQIAVAEQVTAVIIAGDLYDRSVPPAEAVQLLDRCLHQLIEQHGIPVIIISGNHDGPERLGFAARQLRDTGLYIVSSFRAMREPVLLTDEYGTVAVWCMPYNDPADVADFYRQEIKSYQAAHEHLIADIQEQKKQQGLLAARHVLVSHCYLDGASESDSERPLSIGGADRVTAATFADFDYVALGHLHQPQYKLEPWIRYSGSILKYSFSEHQQKKSVTLVRLNEEGFAGVELIPLRARHDVRVIKGEFEDLIKAAATDPAPDDYLLVELTNKELVLDAVTRLRRYYPQIMDLKKERFTGDGLRHKEKSKNQLARQEIDILGDFYQQVTGETLTSEQQRLAQEIIQTVLTDDAAGEPK